MSLRIIEKIFIATAVITFGYFVLDAIDDISNNQTVMVDTIELHTQMISKIRKDCR